MAFDNWLGKSNNKKKEKRKPYRGCKAIDWTCRNHGSCGWCRGNRKYSSTKRQQSVDSQLEEYNNE